MRFIGIRDESVMPFMGVFGYKGGSDVARQTMLTTRMRVVNQFMGVGWVATGFGRKRWIWGRRELCCDPSSGVLWGMEGEIRDIGAGAGISILTMRY